MKASSNVHLSQVVEESKGEEGVPGSVREGGENPSERRCTFMELSLCLTPGLSTAAVKVLYTASSPSLQVSPPPPPFSCRPHHFVDLIIFHAFVCTSSKF